MTGARAGSTLVALALALGGTGAHAAGRAHPHNIGVQTVVVYRDGRLAGGWQDRSWTPHTLAAPAPAGIRGHALRVTFRAWGGLSLHSPTPFSPRGGYVQIALNGGTEGSQHLGFEVTGTDAKTFSKDLPLTDYLPPDYGGLPPRRWMTVRIPLARAILLRGESATGLVLREVGGTQEPVAYIGSIILHARFS